MSGTSADGIDVAVVRIAPGKAAGRRSLRCWRMRHFAYPAALRRAVLAAMNAQVDFDGRTGAAQLAAGPRVCRGGQAKPRKKHKLQLDLVGCHGQTLYHQARAENYAGRKFACTWQAGEAQAIAAELGVPVVSNFRPADMLAGGQGAPLVPLFDYVLFADAKRGRVLQNIGGIANLTAIPSGAAAGSSACIRYRAGKHGDRLAGAETFRQTFRSQRGAGGARNRDRVRCSRKRCGILISNCSPPKTAGREQFGRAYAAEFLEKCLAQIQEPERCAGNRDGADRRDHCAELRAFMLSQDEKPRRGLHRLRRRRAQSDADENAGRKARTTGMHVVRQRRLRIACRSQGSGGVCAAGVAHLASAAGQCAVSNRGKARGNSGAGHLCCESRLQRECASPQEVIPFWKRLS